MYEVNAECGRSVRISYQGENKRTVVHFDLSDIIAEFPGGTAALVIRRYGDTDPVPSSTTELVGTELLWTVTAWECAKRGSLYAQVIYSTSDEVVAKTKIFRFDVADSLTASAEEPEDWEDWVDSLLEAAAQIQTDLSGKLDTPETAGTAGQVLTSDGQGGQSWETPFVPASIIDDTAGSGDTDKVWSADKMVDELAEKYEKPASGIPATDLADGVIPVITGKADKVSGAVSGNFAALDGNGNLIDSGHKHSDYLTEHQDISGKMDEPQSEGTNGQVLTTDGNGGRTWTTPSGGDPTSIIDDTAGAGDTNKVWSADKSASENLALNVAIGVSQPTATSGDVGKFLKLKTIDSNGKPTEFEYGAGGGGGAVEDVQVNGTSVVSSGVANIPVASANDFGTVKIGSGLYINSSNQKLSLDYAAASQVKAGASGSSVLVPSNQHQAVFYGLAKVAGYDEKNSTESVGTYTESAKSAIHQMLDAPETVSGSTPMINAKSGVRYICGECSTLTIVVPSSGIIDVVFESGSTPTVLTVTPPTGVTAIKWANGFDPSSLDANTTYEVNILDGEFGVVGKWT